MLCNRARYRAWRLSCRAASVQPCGRMQAARLDAESPRIKVCKQMGCFFGHKKPAWQWGGELRKHFSKERCSQTAMPFFAVFPLFFGLFLSPVQNQMHRWSYIQSWFPLSWIFCRYGKLRYGLLSVTCYIDYGNKFSQKRWAYCQRVILNRKKNTSYHPLRQLAE